MYRKKRHLLIGMNGCHATEKWLSLRDCRACPPQTWQSLYLDSHFPKGYFQSLLTML